MFLYLNVSHETALKGLLSPILLDLMDLWRRGFLPGNATVWMDAENDTGAFWALTDQSQFVQVIAAGASPGYVRITRDLIRWARSFDDTTKAPLASRDLKSLPGGDKSRVSVVVRHTSPAATVTVIDGSTGKAVKPGPDGTVELDRVTVIDWPKFTGRTFIEPTQYERLNAELHGIEFLCDSVDQAFADFLRKHMSDCRIVIDDVRMKELAGALNAIDGYSQFLAMEMFRNIETMQQNDSAVAHVR